MYRASESRSSIPVRGKLSFGELIEALRQNITQERDSVIYHLSLAEEMDNFDAKQVLLDIASQEISHAQRLSHLIQALIKERAENARKVVWSRDDVLANLYPLNSEWFVNDQKVESFADHHMRRLEEKPEESLPPHQIASE